LTPFANPYFELFGPMFTPEQRLQVSYGDINAIRNGNGFQPGQTLPPQTVKELRRGYYASVSYLDEQLGRVVDALGANGFLDNTVVSFWGDRKHKQLPRCARLRRSILSL